MNIIWKGNMYTNSSSRGSHIPMVIVNHISAGTMASMDSWFTSAGNKVSSSHFGVAKDGRIHQYVDIRRMAWANGIGAADIAASKTPVIIDHPGINPNLYSVSIEHEGTDGELTPKQFAASVWLHKYIQQQMLEIWGMSIELGRYNVIGHFMVNPTGKPLCPGPKFPWILLYAALGEGVVRVPTIVKERIYAVNGVLMRCDGDYKTPATDVRHIKFEKGTYTLKLVWERLKTVSQLIKEHGADYGFNFPFFHESTHDPIADCKIGGKVLNRGYGNQSTWHGFSYKDGQPRIGEIDIEDSLGVDGFLVKTTPLLIEDGNPCWDWYREQEGTAPDIGKDANGDYVRAQRTIVGLDAQGNLHLAVGDGRTGYDRGLTLEEECLFMQSKGCIVALNGDGGGSSVIADKTGSLGQNKGTVERKVNHAVLVFLSPPDEVNPKPIEKDWKQDIHDRAKTAGIIKEDWSGKLDEPAPVWLVLALALNVKK